MASTTDANSQTTSFAYDLVDRRVAANYPDGGQTCLQYSDAPNSICGTLPLMPGSAASQALIKIAEFKTVSSSPPSPPITNAIALDGLSRAVESVLYTALGGGSEVDTSYDRQGRVYSVSNPYGSTSDPTYGVTTYGYDALNRKTIETLPDGNTLQWCYGGVITTGQTICKPNSSSNATNADWVDSADEAGRIAQRLSDGLDRLVAVMEPDPTSGNLALETDYGYDILGNLWNVSQIGNPEKGETPITRGFIYDSLSRLTSAQNPETGPIGYTYDANSNLITKT